MITLYGPARSSAGRCLWCLEEIGLPYENKPIDMRAKEHKSEAFLQINPNGKVPALVDGDVKLFESFAINFYLADKYKPELLGKTHKEKALVHQWSFWSSSELQGPLVQILIQKFFMPDDKRDQNIIDENTKKLPDYFNVLDKSLTTHKYLAGNEFTLADLNAASVATLASSLGFDVSAYRHVQPWLKAIADRPAYQRYQEMRK